MSGRRCRSRWMRSWSSRPSSAEMVSMTMAPALRAAPLGGLRAHVAHHPGHGHLQPAAGGTGGEIEIHAFGAVLAGFEQRRVAAGRRVRRQDPAAAHLLHLGEGVQRPHRHVGHRLLHGGGRLAAVRLAPALRGLPEQQRLGRGGAAIGDQHGAERGGVRLHATSPAKAPAQSMSRNCTRSTRRAVRAITVEPKKAPKHTIRSHRPERERPRAARVSCRKEKKK